MKNPQENLATLNIWSCNVTTSTREPTTSAWISADIWRQDSAICSKNRKIVPYHGSTRIPRLTVSVPDYGSWKSWSNFICIWKVIPCGLCKKKNKKDSTWSQCQSTLLGKHWVCPTRPPIGKPGLNWITHTSCPGLGVSQAIAIPHSLLSSHERWILREEY